FNNNEKEFRVVMDFAHPQGINLITPSQSGKSLIINLSNVSHNLFNNSFDVNSDIVKDMRIDEKNDNTQLILSLKEEQPYKIKTNDNRVEITVSSQNRIKTAKSVEEILTE